MSTRVDFLAEHIEKVPPELHRAEFEKAARGLANGLSEVDEVFLSVLALGHRLRLDEEIVRLTAMRARDAVERRLHPRSQFIGADRSPRRSTAQTSIEAIMHSVRTRGITGLKDPETLLRVKQCDENALKQIAERIAKLRCS